MRIRRKYFVLLVACLVLSAIAIRAYLVPPHAWSQIHIGDSAAQVRATWPAVFSDLHDVKGDFCYRPLFLAHWRLQIVYGADDKVAAKYYVLRVGTRDCYKEFNFSD